MAEVFAGFVIGFAMSLAVATVGAIVLVASNDRSGVAQRVAPPGTNMVALSVVLHFAAMLLFTAVGMILGVLLAGLEERRPDGGLGSPNVAYTLIVVALVAVIVIPAFVVPSVRRYAAVGALVFVGMFGWVMPWLASVG